MDQPIDFIDNIKAEKANAIARYKRFTNITKLFQVIEFFIAIALISWSSTHIPSVLRFFNEYVIAFSSYFMNQHVVFLLGNLIVVVCYFLSRYSDSGNNNSSNYDVVSDVKPMTSSEVQIPVNKTGSETVVEEVTEAMERFRRTNSEKVKRRMTSRRELRRSVTEMRRSEAVECGGDELVQAVEELSNEEFRIAVEMFILKQQRMMIEDEC